jgi:phosphatidylserine/phosphatidylglycerophosphate/cardiolipin synthase-like enzyme
MRICVLLVLLFSAKLFADVFPPNTHYELCFTPQQNCTKELVDFIGSAKSYVHVQAFSFTSWDIADALVAAHKRGVKVVALFDKSLFKAPYNKKTKFLQRAGINVRLDPADNIAHNKVLIVDDSAVETGSFNYTYSAQHFNAENTLIVYSHQLAHQYLANWNRRWALAAK